MQLSHTHTHTHTHTHPQLVVEGRHTNPDAQNVPSFRRWRFERKLSSLYSQFTLRLTKFEVRNQLLVDTIKFKLFEETKNYIIA